MIQQPSVGLVAVGQDDPTEESRNVLLGKRIEQKGLCRNSENEK